MDTKTATPTNESILKGVKVQSSEDQIQEAKTNKADSQ